MLKCQLLGNALDFGDLYNGSSYEMVDFQVATRGIFFRRIISNMCQSYDSQLLQSHQKEMQLNFGEIIERKSSNWCMHQINKRIFGGGIVVQTTYKRNII